MKYYKLPAYMVLEAFRNGEISPTEYVQELYEHIKNVEKKVYSFITLRDLNVLLEEAKAAEYRIREGKARALEGLPIAIKDNISTRGVRTTCASKILENYTPPYDATVVKRIKEEGGLVLGKTNMDEFAMGSTTENSFFGPTRNPWDIERVPGGSSGGSGAALAAGEAPLALGSDTGGSIRCPASFTGCFGLKPTYGLISRYGLVAYANSLEQIGPMARNTLDLALLLTIIAGYDPKDGTTINVKLPNYYSLLKEVDYDLKGLTIGVVKEMCSEGIEKPVLNVFNWSLKVLEGLGADIIEVSLPHLEYALPAYYVIAMSEASSNLARYDGVRYGIRGRIAGDWNEVFMETRGEGFGKEVKRRIILGTFALSAGYFEQYYVKALKIRRLIKNDYERAFSKARVLISPTMPVLPFKIGERIKDPLQMYMVDILTVPVNLAGIPALSIPIGFHNGLPVGLQLMGKPLDELLLLKVSRAFELESKVYDLIAF